MTGNGIPRFLRASLIDDPDEEAKLAAFRAREFGKGDSVVDDGGVYFGESGPSFSGARADVMPIPGAVADEPFASAAAGATAPDQPYLDYSRGMPRPNPRPLSKEAAAQPARLGQMATALGARMRTSAPKVARDLAVGMQEAPFQAIAGAADAGANLLHLLDPIVDLLEKHVAVLPRYEDKRLPPAQSKTGALVRDTARFLSGYTPLRSIAGLGIASSKGASIAASAGTEALTRPPTEENLANLIVRHPELSGPIAAYLKHLASDPSDPLPLAMLKKGIDGAFIATLLSPLERHVLRDGLVHAVRLEGAAKRLGVTSEELLERLQTGAMHTATHTALHDALARHHDDPAEHAR